MMRLTRRSLLTTSLLAGGSLFLASCGGSSTATNHGAMGSAAGSGMPGMSGDYDQNFIDGMVPHHQAAVDMAKVAQKMGEHPEIKQLANDIVTSQDGEIAKMKAWRKTWYGSDQIAPGMGGQTMGGMDTDLGKLAAASPFDKAFIDAMLPHHQSAIQMATEAKTKATHAEIKQLATEIVAAQQREIDQMKAWRAQWYPGQ